MFEHLTKLDLAERNCHLGQGVKTAPHRGQQLAVLGPGVEVVQVPAAGNTLVNPDPAHLLQHLSMWLYCSLILTTAGSGSSNTRSSTISMKMTYSTVQYSTAQHSTVQYSTVQYSTVQYRTAIMYGAGVLAGNLIHI